MQSILYSKKLTKYGGFFLKDMFTAIYMMFCIRLIYFIKMHWVPFNLASFVSQPNQPILITREFFHFCTLAEVLSFPQFLFNEYFLGYTSILPFFSCVQDVMGGRICCIRAGCSVLIRHMVCDMATWPVHGVDYVTVSYLVSTTVGNSNVIA